MSTHNFLKIGHTDESVVQAISPSEFEAHASAEVTDRLNKFAQTIKAIAPRSDDFLYFSIIFLKSAEVCTIDDNGNLKKIGKENAWGHFDDNWKWHGNVKPHKNNNNDIFPESELKKAARNWIGRPLCVDHKSDSVDGVRGVILDTHYDEKLKQIVGLCALDKVNYPDLARKVQTGVVRYGSMGTAVSTSICSECGNRASTPKQYCDHITKKQAWGEINVGLNPIEYSLVVQPAEPGAILLRCFASIQKHDEELKSYGVDTDTLYKKLDDKTANDLDMLLGSVCGENGCSLEQRQKIVRGYLNTNGFTKTSSLKTKKNVLEEAVMAVEVANALTDPEKSSVIKKMLGENIIEKIASAREYPIEESFTSMDSEGVNPTLRGISNVAFPESGVTSGITESHPNTFSPEGDLLSVDLSDDQLSTASIDDTNTVKLSSIMEEIMNESRLRKRAALRRKLAYHQGGSEGVEPKGFKSEDYHKYWADDKQMHQGKSMGGDEGMVPGDEKVKEQLKRAKLEAMRKKIAYHQGGSEGVEPKGFKSEDYHKYWADDKQMHQGKSMGGDEGMFPGDEKVKTMQKRAGYNGPALSTRFRHKRGANGSINKAASSFEVFAGDKLVIAATARDIFGPRLEENWNWINSKDYARAVIAQIRENGLDYVGGLLTKRGQAAPPPPPPGGPDMGPEGAEGEGEEDKAPKQVVEDSLVVMEDNIEKIRDAVNKLSGGEDVDINVNVGNKPGVDVEGAGGEEKMALSRRLMSNLKIALAESKDSADELALLCETYDRRNLLTAKQRADLNNITKEAVREFSNIISKSGTLVKAANSLYSDLVKKAQHGHGIDNSAEDFEAETGEGSYLADDEANDEEGNEASDGLVTAALSMRKARRLEMLKVARRNMVKVASGIEVLDGSKMEYKPHQDMSFSSYDDIDFPRGSGKQWPTDDQADEDEDYEGDDEVGEDEGSELDEEGEGFEGDEDDDFGFLGGDESDDNESDEDMALDEAKDDMSKDKMHMSKDKMHMNKSEDKADSVKEALEKSFLNKKAEEERESYRVKLRRAYNVAMEMQRKGMIAQSRPALDRQVDTMMDFDDKAFEAFKRSVANFQGTVSHVKTASDVSGLNIGLNDDGEQTNATTNSGKVDAKTLASLWD